MTTSKIARLQDRSWLLAQARQFFKDRSILEVDCPILSLHAAVDAHIDLITANYQDHTTYYLHSSPEYGMKRLIAEGMGDIYQLSHVFRDGEWGVKHNPEFMMAEWYRLNFTLSQLIEETIAFIHIFLDTIPHRIVSYRQLFLHYAGFDYVHISEADLIDYIKKQDLLPYSHLLQESKDHLLNWILGSIIEPQLGKNELLVLKHYPASQAALAQKKWVEDEEVAERFEIYYQGVELANGYHELAHAEEQRKRLIEANQQRLHMGKHPLPIDEKFLQALAKGLPDCCGVAVGFDRLVMLRQKQATIADVLSWGWSEA